MATSAMRMAARVRMTSGEEDMGQRLDSTIHRLPVPFGSLAHKKRNLEAKVPAERWPAFKSEAWACYTAASPAIAEVLHEQRRRRASPAHAAAS